jgi:hypothetical protein
LPDVTSSKRHENGTLDPTNRHSPEVEAARLSTATPGRRQHLDGDETIGRKQIVLAAFVNDTKISSAIPTCSGGP